MSLIDVLMTLLILITRYRDDLDFILIEDVALLNYDLGFGLLKQGLLDLTRLSTNDLIYVGY